MGRELDKILAEEAELTGRKSAILRRRLKAAREAGDLKELNRISADLDAALREIIKR